MNHQKVKLRFDRVLKTLGDRCSQVSDLLHSEEQITFEHLAAFDDYVLNINKILHLIITTAEELKTSKDLSHQDIALIELDINKAIEQRDTAISNMEYMEKWKSRERIYERS